MIPCALFFRFFFSSRRRHTTYIGDWSSDVCSSDLPYYPGARDRYDRFLDAHPDAQRYGDDGPGCVPWTMIPGLRTDAEQEKIGRASCREREETAVDRGAFNQAQE